MQLTRLAVVRPLTVLMGLLDVTRDWCHIECQGPRVAVAPATFN